MAPFLTEKCDALHTSEKEILLTSPLEGAGARSYGGTEHLAGCSAVQS